MDWSQKFHCGNYSLTSIGFIVLLGWRANYFGVFMMDVKNIFVGHDHVKWVFHYRVVFTEWPNYTKGIIFRNEFPNIDHGPRLYSYTQRIIFIVACECISHTWEGSNGIFPFHNCVTDGSAVHALEHICEYLYHLSVSWSHCLSVRTPNESVWNFLELLYYANTAYALSNWNYSQFTQKPAVFMFA